jgi:esterase
MSPTPFPASLGATRVAATDNPAREIVMLHGIYGRGRNWLGIARTLVAARPEYGCWLLDLPHHGESGPGAHGNTITGLAADVDDWLIAQAITPDAILGHSYGGKVSLALAERRIETPLQVWVIDSTPEIKSPSGSAWAMLEIIRRLPSRFATRDEAVSAIVERGFPVGVAQWMATNLVRQGDGFVWRLDFDVMEHLLHDFFATDLWSVAESGRPGLDIHFLKASESSAISADAVNRLTAATSGGHLHLHHRNGGHWIHAEAPDVVAALLIEHLPR